MGSLNLTLKIWRQDGPSKTVSGPDVFLRYAARPLPTAAALWKYRYRSRQPLVVNTSLFPCSSIRTADLLVDRSQFPKQCGQELVICSICHTCARIAHTVCGNHGSLSGDTSMSRNAKAPLDPLFSMDEIH